MIAEGYAAITARRLAAEAGLNHGLIHYYFGSMDEVLVQVLERFTARLITRQRELYAAPAPFIEKWRGAMRFFEQDRESGYQKVWFELQALAWNRPGLRSRVAAVNAEWRTAMTEALEAAAREHGVDTDVFPVPAIVSLVMTFNEGMILEGLNGIEGGHRELLDAIDEWLERSQGGGGR